MTDTDTDTRAQLQPDSARTTVEAEVRQALGRHARLTRSAADLEPTASLAEAGLTSHATVHLMLDLEDALEVELPEELITKETFATIDALVAALLSAREA